MERKRDPKFVPFWESNALIEISRALARGELEETDAGERRSEVRPAEASPGVVAAACNAEGGPGGASSSSTSTSTSTSTNSSSHDQGRSSSAPSTSPASSPTTSTSTTSTDGVTRRPVKPDDVKANDSDKATQRDAETQEDDITSLPSDLIGAYQEFGLIAEEGSDASSRKAATELEESALRERCDIKAVTDAVNHLLTRV